MPANGAGRLIMWPSISPHGHLPPRPAYYVTWPGWERYRTEYLGQSATYDCFTPIVIDEPANFFSSMALVKQLLEEGVRDIPPESFLPPHSFGLGDAIRAGQPNKERLNRVPPHWLLAVAAIGDSLSAQSREGLESALESRARMHGALIGDEPNELEPEFGLEPEPEPELELESEPESEELGSLEGEVSSGAALEAIPKGLSSGDDVEEGGDKAAMAIQEAWLVFARPLLKPGDMLWSPFAGLVKDAKL